MPVQVTVLYPKVENYKFDEQYYKDVHMPLAAKHFGPYGLKEWSIAKLSLPDPSADCPYGIQASLTFGTRDEATSAFSKGGKEVLADIPNFTNSQATILIGEVYGTGHGDK